MMDKVFTFFTTVMVITGVGIALRPNAPTAKVIGATLTGVAGLEKSAYGPS